MIRIYQDYECVEQLVKAATVNARGRICLKREEIGSWIRFYLECKVQAFMSVLNQGFNALRCRMFKNYMRESADMWENLFCIHGNMTGMQKQLARSVK